MERLPLPEFAEYDDMGNYTNFYDGADLSTWPPFEGLPTGTTEAPNGWSEDTPVQLHFPCYYREGVRE
jgi:hypothetical protein